VFLQVTKPFNRKDEFLSNGKDDNFVKQIDLINKASKEKAIKLEEEKIKNKKQEEKKDYKITEQLSKEKQTASAEPLSIELPRSRKTYISSYRL
jgi:hypothetical protein